MYWSPPHWWESLQTSCWLKSLEWATTIVKGGTPHWWEPFQASCWVKSLDLAIIKRDGTLKELFQASRRVKRLTLEWACTLVRASHNVLCQVYLVLSGLGMKMWCTVIYCRCCLFILKYIHDSFYCKLNDEYIQDEFPTFISLYVESSSILLFPSVSHPLLRQVSDRLSVTAQFWSHDRFLNHSTR